MIGSELQRLVALARESTDPEIRAAVAAVDTWTAAEKLLTAKENGHDE